MGAGTIKKHLIRMESGAQYNHLFTVSVFFKRQSKFIA